MDDLYRGTPILGNPQMAQKIGKFPFLILTQAKIFSKER